MQNRLEPTMGQVLWEIVRSLSEGENFPGFRSMLSLHSGANSACCLGSIQAAASDFPAHGLPT
jgi:hypothetical protein